MNSVSSFIEKRLAQLFAGKTIQRPNDEKDYCGKIGKTIDKHNALLERIEFEGIQLSKEDYAKMRLEKPEAFKGKNMLLVSRASDDRRFEIEILG